MSIKHSIRTKSNGKVREVLLTRKKAINCHCAECMGFVNSEIAICSDNHCPLYPFRPVK
jgi:hypothetical protein